MQKTLDTRKYLEKIKQYETASMIAYYEKETAEAIEVKDNIFYTIKKSRIETSFCYGYGMYACSTQEEEQEAREAVNYMRTRADYFMDENLKSINELIKEFQDKSNDSLYINGSYKDIFKLVGAYPVNKSTQKAMFKCVKDEQFITLNDDLRERIILALEDEKDRLIKRLNIYLKKYGLTKLKVWSYIRD